MQVTQTTHTGSPLKALERAFRHKSEVADDELAKEPLSLASIFDSMQDTAKDDDNALKVPLRGKHSGLNAYGRTLEASNIYANNTQLSTTECYL